MKPHPNATVATGSTGAAVFIVWLLGYLHVALSNEVAVTLAGGLTVLVLLIGRVGFRGLVGILWRGRS